MIEATAHQIKFPICIKWRILLMIQDDLRVLIMLIAEHIAETIVESVIRVSTPISRLVFMVNCSVCYNYQFANITHFMTEILEELSTSISLRPVLRIYEAVMFDTSDSKIDI
jgi:hypothetical protein